MTITEKNYNKLSNIVYLLDPKHKNYASYLKEAGIYNFGNTKFQILKNQRLIGRHAGDGCSANRP